MWKAMTTMVNNLQEMIGLLVAVLIFAIISPTIVDNLTDLSEDAKTQATNETLGNGAGSYTFAQASLPNAISDVVIYNGTNSLLTNVTHYTEYRNNNSVTILAAAGSQNNAILATYTYIPDGSRNMSTTDQTMIAIVFLVFVTSVILAIRREFS